MSPQVEFELEAFEQVQATSSTALLRLSGRWHSPSRERLTPPLLLIDDGGYGILREYQRDAYGETHAVDLVQPDLLAVCAACGVAARATTPERIAADLGWAFEADGPAALVLRETLVSAKPTP